ncbi:NAD binding domain of 6-phosphogluconate dehydrogenase, putative [Eimeria maxima]|uniref:NAD binding domain of 6-phosphogluconate dehydrogenase, putative n=1 Tax=Eimeria maxima TaxID=5804 RepID=U6M9S1_EIMMA|nr:NAD binding domain of 6-phosphogluconate dehydrogenase, putative [Eimeria maxima]CDJ60962.1 NAD binding domain of 6-phosphogluconate dehydrogenase, putative [Eimeria maxima]
MSSIEVIPGKTRIGWIGTGVMGRPMCENILKKGFSLTVYNRTASKAAALQQLGAAVAATAAEVAAAVDVLCIMVGTPDDVQQLILGPGGVSSRLSPGDVGARNGTLTVMAGGDAKTFENLRPLFEAVGTNIIHAGPAGSGQRMKLCNQITLCTNLVGLAEGLLFAERAGLDIEKTLAVLSGGGAASWSVSTYGPRIRDGDFRPGFFVRHLVKDLRLALNEAARLKLALPGLGLALQLYQALEAQGGGSLGVHALKIALNNINAQNKSIEDVVGQLN